MKMKRRFVIGLLCGLTCLAGCNGGGAPKDTFVLEGKLAGTGGGFRLMYDDTLNRHAYAEVEAADAFRTEIKLKEPQVVKASFADRRFLKMAGRGFIPCNSSYLMFVAQPGVELEVNGTLEKDFIDIYPGGDAENDIFREYTSAMHPVLNDCVNLMLVNMLDSTLTADEKAANEKRVEEYDAEMERIRFAFLDKHASSVGGLWLLEDMLVRTQIGMDRAEHYLNMVDKKYAGLTYYRNVAARVEGAKATAVGQPAPAIRTNRTYDRKPFDLEDCRGKYVLIDFWGTWCGACIAGMPEMKAFAAKHADKLVLLGIAQESLDEKRWRDYLDKSEWDWEQVLVGEGEEDYVARYNVQGFPTKILVGPDGRILKRLVGEDPAFYEELEQLMK